MKTERKLWLISILISVVFLFLISLTWHREITYHPLFKEELATQTDVSRYINENWKTKYPQYAQSTLYIPTGLFIQSLYFLDVNTVNLSGYLWQKYPKNLPGGISKDFIFPEAIGSDSSTKKMIYNKEENESVVIGWYFETNLHLNFDYSNFPLDYQDVNINLWHKDFDKNVILTPDLNSYDSTLPGEVFGIDKAIVLKDLELVESYFSYTLSDYNTNFGIKDFIGKTGFPELYFSIRLDRKITDALLVYLFPIIIVWIILFALQVSLTFNSDVATKRMLSMPTLITALSALFFVIILIHIDLRTNFSGEEFLYIEYFYLIAYLLILLVTFNVIAIFTKLGKRLKFFTYKDNLIPKLLFWPTALCLIMIATTMKFWY